MYAHHELLNTNNYQMNVLGGNTLCLTHILCPDSTSLDPLATTTHKYVYVSKHWILHSTDDSTSVFPYYSTHVPEPTPTMNMQMHPCPW